MPQLRACQHVHPGLLAFINQAISAAVMRCRATRLEGADRGWCRPSANLDVPCVRPRNRWRIATTEPGRVSHAVPVLDLPRTPGVSQRRTPRAGLRTLGGAARRTGGPSAFPVRARQPRFPLRHRIVVLCRQRTSGPSCALRRHLRCGCLPTGKAKQRTSVVVASDTPKQERAS